MNLLKASPVPNHPLFPSNYPGPGQVALLCEGDRTGYEAAFLGRWLREEPFDNWTVDVWPCGTGNGLFAMADAIGRTVYIAAIEDRDFRTVEQAGGDCKKKHRDREQRNIAIRGWMTWARNEIENYFLDSDVLVPVMRLAFRCGESDVLESLDQALRLLGPFQSLQATVSEARLAWEETDASQLIVPSRPKWTSAGLEPVDVLHMSEALESACLKWQRRFIVDGVTQEPFFGRQVIASFESRLATWGSMQRSSADWLENWAGKEVLKLVRQQLAARFETPVHTQRSDSRVPPVQWHTLANNSTRNELDRDIERAIQPVLVRQLWENCAASPDSPIRSSLKDLRAILGPQ